MKPRRMFHPRRLSVGVLGLAGLLLLGSCESRLQATITATGTVDAPVSVSTTAQPDEGGSVTIEGPGEDLRVNDTVTISAVPREGWDFDHWSGDLEGTEARRSLTLAEDLEVRAHFRRLRHVLVVEAAGKGGVSLEEPDAAHIAEGIAQGSPYEGSFAHGTSLRLSADAASGWSFAGWDPNPGDHAPNPLVLELNEDLRVTARFVAVEHRVTVAAGTGGRVRLSEGDAGSTDGQASPDLLDVAPGVTESLDLPHESSISVTGVPEPGYRFSHWEGDITGSLNPREHRLAGDLTVTAVFAASAYRVLTFTEGAGSVGHTLLDGAELRHGGRVRFEAEPAPGRRFVGWRGDLQGSENPAVVRAEEDLTVTAVFAPVPRRVETAAVGGGSVEVEIIEHAGATGGGSAAGGTLDGGSPEGGYRDGTEIRLTAVPGEGRLFSHWEGDITGSLNPREHRLAGDLTVTAVFEPTRHSLDVRSIGGGSVSRSIVDTVDGFPRLRLTAHPDQHRYFVGWSGAVTGSAEDVYIVLNQDSEVTAEFARRRYEVNSSVAGRGRVRAEVVGGGPMVAGAKLRLSAEPERGWSFRHWNHDPADTANPKTITLDGDRAVHAEFQRTEWALLFYMSGDNELEESMLADINELEAAEIDGDTVALVLADRAAGHATSAGNWEGTRLYRVRHDPDGINGTVVSQRRASPELGLEDDVSTELNLGSGATLAAFLDYAERVHAAERTALVIWGHGSGYRSAGTAAGGLTVQSVEGSGSTLRAGTETDFPGLQTSGGTKPRRRPSGAKGTSVDDGSGGDVLLTPELGAALEGRDISVLGLDLCYGASLELIYEVREEVGLVVASQNLVDRDGWEYDGLLRRFQGSDRSPGALARAAREEFARAYAGRQGATISVIDADRVSHVQGALNALADDLFDWTTTTERQTQLRSGIFAEVEDFYETPGELSIDLHDVGRYIADEVPAAADSARSLQAAVDDAVRSRWRAAGGVPNAHGLSVHFVPLDAQGLPRRHDAAYMPGGAASDPLEFVESSRWVPDLASETGLLYRLWYEAL